jgi:hypothetical protein
MEIVNMSPQHVRNQRRIHVPASADLAFQLFTPRGEELWIDEWRPRYIHPADGGTTTGMVFTTGEGEEFTVWQMLEYDLAARRSVYARTTPARRVGTVTVSARPAGPDETEVLVQYDMTALRPDDPDALAQYQDPRFGEMLDEWERSIRERMPRLMALLS